MKSSFVKAALILGVLAALITAVAAAQPDLKEGATKVTQNLEQERAELVAAPILEPKGASGSAWYIVQLQDEPLATYRGQIDGLAATNPAVRGEVKLDTESRASQAYLAYLETQQATFLAEVGQSLARSVEVAHQYSYAFNGVALELTAEEAAVVAKLPNVRQLQRNFYRQLLTDYGPEWIGADAIWDGSALSGPENRGEGVIVGVIDSGINMDHPSFADVGGDGYDHTNPFGAGNYVGWCDSGHPDYDASLVCNDKLIGVYSYAASGGDPEDDDGHGSHTASTAAGNVVTATLDISATIDISPTLSVTTTNPFEYEAGISGVAPHANIIAYDACAEDGCPLLDLVESIDQATSDGVDVINYSIGGDSSNPWNDSDSLAFLNAFQAGIVPVTSAGNDGPGEGTVGSPADAPWMISVAASTHNRAFPNALIDMSGGGTPPADINGAGISESYGPAPIVYAGDYGDALCLAPFPPGTFSGEIVVCDRGQIARVEKGVNVLAGGAGGYVLANSSAGQTLNSDAHALPAVHISFADGQTLKSWLASGFGHTATIGGASIDVDNANGDMMAGFSSRGPNPAMPDVIKPDVSAPGVDILAAYKSGGTNDTVNYVDEFNVISGTSMSSPHVAGAAALLRAVRPNWTAAQIRSALMATATNQNTVKEDGSTPTDPFDVGGGRVQVDSAAQAGFVLDETAVAYVDANPGLGGDPRTLNIASLGDSQCLITCSWTRTISSTIGTSVEWNASTAAAAGMSLTVEPMTFTLGAYATQIVTFTVDVSGAPTGDWIFSQVNFTTTEPIPDAHFPVAAVPVSAVLPDQIDINARRDAGSRLVEDLAAGGITDLDVGLSGLTEATLTTETLSEDSDNSTPYDDVSDGAFYVTVNVPAGAQRLVAEITASQAPDIDLFWGQDSNSNGMPDAGEELDSSTTSSYEEYLNLNDPPAGTYWILVQNWDASAAGAADEVTLATAVVPNADAGNMSVDGPTSVPAGTPFDIRLYWDTPAMEVGDRWYGAVSLGTDGSSPGNIGTVPVNVRRLEDDVTKTASATAALPGDTLTYTITIQPNMTLESVTYALTDTIPAGLTYVSGSASATAGTVSVAGNQLTWTGTLLPPDLTYNLSTSSDDPDCQTPVGGYWDLQTQNGFPPDPGVSGDSIAFTYSDAPEIYGVPGGILDYTDDGYATRSDIFSLVNQDLPDPSSPNDLIAALWRDMRIVYDAGTNRGVTSASNPFLRIVEFDDIEDFNDSNQRLDMEIITFYEPVDDFPEIILAYDNVALTGNTGTIGVENEDGSEAVQFAYNDFIPTDSLVICFDWRTSAEPVEITYQVTVDNDMPLGSAVTNTVVHESDNPGSKIADTSLTVRIGYRILMPLIVKNGG